MKSVSRQRSDKHTSTTINILLEAVFSTRSVQSGCKKENWVYPVRVEAGSNTYTVALRVVDSDGKGTQCLGLQLAHPVSGDKNTGTWHSRLEESRI
jgi:hypothetical protein